VAGIVWVAAWITLVALNDFFGSGPDPSRNAPAETRRQVEVGGITSVQEQFDGLPMDSRLPAPWTTSGGGSAQIVALPTSVDRSVRLASDAGGVATEACRPTDVAAGTDIRVALEYRVGGAAPAPFPLLSLQSGDTRRVGLLIGAGGSEVAVLGGADAGPSDAPVVSPVPRATAATTGWHRVELTIARASGAVTWRVHDEAGAETASGTATVADLASGGLDRVCLRSPGGSPSGWVAVDDLVIEG
jgi:hypothetical protein